MATEPWDIDTPGAPPERWLVLTILVGAKDTVTEFCWVGEIELLLAWPWACCWREFNTFCWNSSKDRAGMAFSSFSTSNGCKKWICEDIISRSSCKCCCLLDSNVIKNHQLPPRLPVLKALKLDFFVVSIERKMAVHLIVEFPFAIQKHLLCFHNWHCSLDPKYD